MKFNSFLKSKKMSLKKSIEAPIIIKTEEKPKVKSKIKGRSFKLFFSEVFCKSAKDLPTIYEINPGTMGNTQGERKLNIPARNAIVKGISWDIN